VKKANKKEKLDSKLLTFLVAPDVPPTELQALEDHWAEFIRDPDYSIVTNYEFRVDEVLVTPHQRLVVQAPNIPTKEVTKLCKTIDAMRAGKRSPYKALNYDITVFTVLRFANV
jgi:hypothetical protein